MRTTLTIARREFRSYFDSPLAYVVICVSLVVIGGFFFFYGGGYWQADRATVSQLFQWLPMGLSLLVAPVITMRLLAEEKRSGTLELLITLPVQDHEVILGKFFGAWGLVLVLIASTMLYPLMMFTWPWHLGPLDWGPVFSGYFGLFFFSGAVVAIGLLISSLTESQVIALFLTWIVLVVMQVLIGWFGDSWSNPTVREIANFLSFSARLAPFSRGIINTRDVIYFATIAVGCLMGAFRALERRKWA